jgi:predicted CXXCH cytochrome family protein
VKAEVGADVLKRCEGCHDFAALRGAKVAHAPVKAGECFRCHTPHASSRPHLLLQGGADLCFGCHEKERKTFDAATVHAPVRKGECLACHAPHGSENKALAVKAGPELCLSCHARQRALAGARWVHDPFKSGDCDACHRPHASAEKALLTEPVPKLCGGCHDVEGDGLKPKHGGKAPAARCLECHDPHGSSGPGKR